MIEWDPAAWYAAGVQVATPSVSAWLPQPVIALAPSLKLTVPPSGAGFNSAMRKTT